MLRCAAAVCLALSTGFALAADTVTTTGTTIDDGQTTIVVSNDEGELLYEVNHERSLQRFSPCSTFKIPNALIALQHGSLPRHDTTLHYDALRDPRQDWWPRRWDRDHTLASAMRYSVVWYFQELARRSGSALMQKSLDDFDYGNRDISSGIDQFWLSGSLRISAAEQVTFLRAFHAGRLGLFETDTEQVKEALLIDVGDGWELHAKTGGCELEGERFLGWYVGFVESPGSAVFFALNTEADTWQGVQARRLQLLQHTLQQAGFWPEDQD